MAVTWLTVQGKPAVIRSGHGGGVRGGATWCIDALDLKADSPATLWEFTIGLNRRRSTVPQ
ncbi:hypothetical protein GCM10011576_34720 [Micromonospora parathelypteridis]|nr:hypothetical protein GCM10011576_34720 [Micromonospora parathelypteridis]